MATAAVASLDFLLEQPNALLGTHDTPRPADTLYVPTAYIAHLNRTLSEERRHPQNLVTLLRNFARVLQETSHDGAPFTHRPNGLLVRFVLPVDESDATQQTPVDHAIDVAKRANGPTTPIPILTHDPALSALAVIKGIATIRPDPPLIYTGRRAVSLSDEALKHIAEADHQPITLATWQQQIDPGCAKLQPNEFIEISNPPPDGNFSSSTHDESIAQKPETPDQPASEGQPEDQPKPRPFPALHRFDAAAGVVTPLNHQYFNLPKCEPIHPKTAGQHFLLEALLAPADEIPIVIVQGEFGTGKTFLSVAAGYDGVKSKRYSSVVVCPRDSRLGDDIGALPGDADEKTRAKALSFTDNLYQVIEIAEQIPVTPKAHSTAKGKMEEFIRESVEFVPLVEMGGRSLSERFIIYDEAQDMTPSQARALVTRLADRSKMVVMGDLSQVNNPRLSRTNNGLHYLLTRLAGKSSGIAVINLEPNEIVRHSLLREIASYL